MRIYLTVTAALLALLTGVVVWVLQPDYRAFSWTTHVSREYVVGYLPGEVIGGPGNEPEISLLDAEDAIASLYASVQGAYTAYTGVGEMGRRIETADGVSAPLHHGGWNTSGYFAARGLSVRFGTLPAQQQEIVLGDALARRLYEDPALAVGERVELASSFRSETFIVSGVLQPSPAQDTELDADDGIAGLLQGRLDSDTGLLGMMPLFLQLVFDSQAEAERLEPELTAWVHSYFGAEGGVRSRESTFAPDRQADLLQTRFDVDTRRVTLLAFGLLILVSAAGTLVTQLHFHLVRRRQLLGVDKALGATRATLVARLAASQLSWILLGTAAGYASLQFLHHLLPDLFLTRPPIIVSVLAVTAPVTVLLVLIALTSLPLLTSSALELLRGRIKGRRIRSLLWLVYGSLALAIAGGLAATQVYLQVQREADTLRAQFGSMYSLQAGAAIIDTRLERSFEGGALGTPPFSEADAGSVAQVAGVRSAALAQTIPHLGVSAADRTTELRTAAADGTYLELMGLSLATGGSGGCVLSAAAATNLRAGVGSVLTLQGLSAPVDCQVSGILEPSPPLWGWLVADLPDLIAPPLDGLGLALPGYTAEPFRSIRILLQLESPTVEGEVRQWLAANYPGVPAEIIPYTPDAGDLLENLRVQAQLFLLIAAMAAVLAVWGIIAGFRTLLEAERFRLALDRAFGLSVRSMAFSSWQQTLGLGLLSASLGASVGYLLAVRLYNAFALDIHSLPRREALAIDPLLITIIFASLFVLSALLTAAAARWLSRQSSLAMLKEGAL